MFDNVEQLEKQVKSFQENVLASSELIKGIDELIALLKAQQLSYEISTNALISEMEAYSDGIKSTASDTSANMVKEAKAMLSEVQRKNNILTDEVKKRAEAVESFTRDAIQALCKDNHVQLDAAVYRFSETQKLYIDKLNEVDTSVKGSAVELSNKQQEFIKKIESTNVDQLFKTLQESKKSIETKLYALMAGLGIIIIISALSLLLK